MKKLIINHLVEASNTGNSPLQKVKNDNPIVFKVFGFTLIFFACFKLYADSRLPGVDVANKLEAAGTLLRIIDTALFIWGARIFAGIAILSAGWNLKEQRFGMAIICVVSALIFGTAPMWVKNIFDIGGGNGIFT